LARAKSHSAILDHFPDPGACGTSYVEIKIGKCELIWSL
jgi:hypothetical protein